MYSDFFLIEREGAPVVRAERLAFGETSGRNEAWLRDTLLQNPGIVPVRQIDPSFGPLVPLCRELRTEAGPLDAAFINAEGRLTLVECKLWRNPEARRKVVAQVLDYARAISRWSYSDLQRQVSSATGMKGNVPFDLVSAVTPGLQEHQFVDAAAAAMRSGKFLLLIAGDGIREDVGALAELINRNAASGFAFGLVEVALYGLDDGGLVVQPRVVARTQIIERTVVLLRDGDRQTLSSDTEGDPAAFATAAGTATETNALGESPRQAAYRAWWKPVLEAKLDDPDQEPPKLHWMNHIRAQLPWQGTWILAFTSGAKSAAVCLSGRTSEHAELVRRLNEQRQEILAELPEGSAYEDSTFICRRRLDEFADDNAVRTWLIATINTFINVLRPRIKALLAAT
jgi:hypothetical protein